MTKKLISYDDEAEGGGLPAIVAQEIAAQTEGIVAALSNGLVSRGRISPNLIDISAITPGFSPVNGGGFAPNPTRFLTDWIEVDPSSPYIWSFDGDSPPVGEITFQRYDGDKNTIGAVSVSASFSTTSQTRYIRGAILNEHMDSVQLEKGTVATEYAPYGKQSPPELVAILDDLTEKVNSGSGGNSAGTPVPISRPMGLLEWEELPHQGRRLANAYDGNLYLYMRVDGLTSLFRSTDSGETFERGFRAVDTPSGDRGVATVTVWEDGTVTVIGQDGRIYRADSFDGTPRLVYSTTSGNNLDRICTSTYSDPATGKRWMFAGEYDSTTPMKYMYYSLDAGETWDVLKEGDTLNEGNNHWHASVYDPYRDQIWLSQGDGDNSRVYMTPDWGTTWHHYPHTYHPTTLFAFPDRVVMGRDKTGQKPGISESDGTVPLEITDALTFREDRWSFNFYPNRTNWNRQDNTYYMVFPAKLPEDPDSYIFATGDGGETWHLVTKGDKAATALTGIDKNGYLFATSWDGNDAPLYRAKALDWYRARG